MTLWPRRKISTALVWILGLPLVWLALSQQSAETDSPIDPYAYHAVMERQIMDTADLDDLVRDERWIYERITPPFADFVLRQPVAPVIPFDWEHFPDNLPELLGDRYQYEYSVPVYKLRAVEDRQTRQLHFYEVPAEPLALQSGTGILPVDHVNHHLGSEYPLFSIPAPADYDPFAWLKSRYPGLYSGRYALSEIHAMEAQYDPARIELLVTLIPTDYVEHHL